MPVNPCVADATRSPRAIVLTLIYGAENVTVTPSGILVSKTSPTAAFPPGDTTERADSRELGDTVERGDG